MGEDENAGLRSRHRSLGGWGNAGPVSGLTRDESLAGFPVTFPERRSSGPGKVSRSCIALERGAYRCGAAQDSHLLPVHPARKLWFQPPIRRVTSASPTRGKHWGIVISVDQRGLIRSGGRQRLL